jgi:hypothetical protein
MISASFPHHAAFTLILTFFLGEKEQPLSAPGNSNGRSAAASHGFAKRLGTILPLPAGEGRGEGENSAPPYGCAKIKPL